MVDDLQANIRGAREAGAVGALQLRPRHDDRRGGDPLGTARLTLDPARGGRLARSAGWTRRGRIGHRLSPAGGSEPTGSSPSCWACGACGSTGGAPVSPGRPVIVESRIRLATNPSAPGGSASPAEPGVPVVVCVSDEAAPSESSASASASADPPTPRSAESGVEVAESAASGSADSRPGVPMRRPGSRRLRGRRHYRRRCSCQVFDHQRICQTTAGRHGTCRGAPGGCQNGVLLLGRHVARTGRHLGLRAARHLLRRARRPGRWCRRRRCTAAPGPRRCRPGPRARRSARWPRRPRGPAPGRPARRAGRRTPWPCSRSHPFPWNRSVPCARCRPTGRTPRGGGAVSGGAGGAARTPRPRPRWPRERLDAAVHRDRQHAVAAGAHRRRQPVGLVAEHERDPLAAARRRAATPRPRPARRPRNRRRAGPRSPPRRCRAQHRRPERHPGRRLDHQRVDRRDAAAGQQDAVEPGRGRAAQDHADVRRVGDAVQHEHGARGRRRGRARNSSTAAIRGATTSASTPWSWRPLPASTFTRCARRPLHRHPAGAGGGEDRAHRLAARAVGQRSPCRRAASASSSASSTGLRPYTVMKVSLGERGTAASVPRRRPSRLGSRHAAPALRARRVVPLPGAADHADARRRGVGVPRGRRPDSTTTAWSSSSSSGSRWCRATGRRCATCRATWPARCGSTTPTSTSPTTSAARRCRGPGSDAQLTELVARLMSRPLDHTRPLWEMYLVEGLAKGRTAVHDQDPPGDGRRRQRDRHRPGHPRRVRPSRARSPEELWMPRPEPR